MIRYPSQGRFPRFSPLEWLEDIWGGADGSQGQVMPMDVRETDSGYVVEAALPGIKPDDVEVTLDGRFLTIRGRAGKQRDSEEGRYLLRERRSTSFSRSLTLPAEIDPDGVTTTFDDGELCVMLPISKRAGSRRIPVGTGARAARQVGGATDGGIQKDGQAGNEAQSGNGDGTHASPVATGGQGSR